MKFISNLSAHVFVIIVKSQEKIKPVKWSFLNFNLNGQIVLNETIKILCKFPAVCSIYIRVLVCIGIDLDDIMQIDCLAYKYFVFNRFSLVGCTIWY